MEEEIQKYNSSLAELSVCIEHIVSVSVFLTDRPTETESQYYGSFLFAKLALHAASFRSLLPEVPNNDPHTVQIWDLSSLSVLLRTIIDNYYAFYYIAADSNDATEIELRILVWKYHSEHTRLQGVKRIGASGRRVDDLRRTVKAFRNQLESNSAFLNLDVGLRKKVREGRISFLYSNSELSDRCGIDRNYYKATFDRLSSFVHSMPFSLSQLMQFRADDKASLSLLKGLVDQCVGFLAAAIRQIDSVFPEIDVEISEELTSIVAKWKLMLAVFSARGT